MPAPLTAVMIGAGQRGYYAYGPFALAYPEELKFVAVAEPDPARRRRFAKAHGIPLDRQFVTWEEVCAQTQLADAYFNMTPEQLHHASTKAALEAGYDVLLEVPMATTLAHCLELVQTSQRTHKILQLCHSLRYTPFFSTLYEVLRSGQVGDIVTVAHRENVVYWHMAHSYVRGNQRRSDASGPMLLTHCCHDLDILAWNLASPVQQIQSFGSLIHFRPENAPPGATRRCTDGCPVADCLYDARRIYLNLSNAGWPITTISADLSLIGRQQAIETGPYGCCVYHGDNDVVDHQTVNMRLDNGASVVLVMHGHAYEDKRTMRYDGTRATVRGKYGNGSGSLEIHGHLTNRWETVEIPRAASGPPDGDFGLVRAFIQAVRGEAKAAATAREVLEGHLLAFAAEEARLKNMVIDMSAFRHKAEQYY